MSPTPSSMAGDFTTGIDQTGDAPAACGCQIQVFGVVRMKDHAVRDHVDEIQQRPRFAKRSEDVRGGRLGVGSPTWLTDITEHRTEEDKLYLCAIKDAFSGRIVGYSIDERMKASLAVAALRNAIALRRPSGTLVHSDRGCQFRSAKFLRVLRDNDLVGSMGRTGACADKPAMESFFALPQRDVFDRRRWPTREELRLAIVIWIERTYHRRRRQRRLCKLTPRRCSLGPLSSPKEMHRFLGSVDAAGSRAGPHPPAVREPNPR